MTGPTGRAAPFPLPEPAPDGDPWASPAACADLLLRPWSVDGWVSRATAGWQTGAPDVGTPGFEVLVFTTLDATDAEEVVADLRGRLVSGECAAATVRPPPRGAPPLAVRIAPREADPTDAACPSFNYTATASARGPGPRAVTVQVLQHVNTVSLLVAPGSDDLLVLAGASLPTEDERPQPSELCDALRDRAGPR